MAHPVLGDNETDQQGSRQRDRTQGEGGEPTPVRRGDDGVDGEEHASRQRDGTHEVMAAVRSRLVTRDKSDTRDKREHSKRNRGQERPAPAETREQPAKDQPRRVAASTKNREDRQRPVACGPLRKAGGQNGQGSRRGKRSRKALHETSDNEQRAVIDQTAHK